MPSRTPPLPARRNVPTCGSRLHSSMRLEGSPGSGLGVDASVWRWTPGICNPAAWEGRGPHGGCHVGSIGVSFVLSFVAWLSVAIAGRPHTAVTEITAYEQFVLKRIQPHR